MSIDPLAAKYPWNSPYAFSENNPIAFLELEGLETVYVITGEAEKLFILEVFQGRNKTSILRDLASGFVSPDDDGYLNTGYTVTDSRLEEGRDYIAISGVQGLIKLSRRGDEPALVAVGENEVAKNWRIHFTSSDGVANPDRRTGNADAIINIDMLLLALQVMGPAGSDGPKSRHYQANGDWRNAESPFQMAYELALNGNELAGRYGEIRK